MKHKDVNLIPVQFKSLEILTQQSCISMISFSDAEFWGKLQPLWQFCVIYTQKKLKVLSVILFLD